MERARYTCHRNRAHPNAAPVDEYAQPGTVQAEAGDLAPSARHLRDRSYVLVRREIESIGVRGAMRYASSALAGGAESE
jgi:hypothetical protein